MRNLRLFMGVFILSSSLYAMPVLMNGNSSMCKRDQNLAEIKSQRIWINGNGRGGWGRGWNKRFFGYHGFREINDNSGEETSLFSTHKSCIQCHNNLRDSTGEDVSIVKDWKGSMMASAAADPLWQAKVHTEIIRNPSFRNVIEKKCSTCHMPMAETQAKFDSEEIKMFNDGFLDPNNKYHKIAMDGVSCTICHQIKSDNLGDTSSFSGGYLIDEFTEKPYRKIYGPYKNPFSRPMIRHAKYQPVYSEHIKKSELCATCHTLKTPTVYQGNVVGEFPEQTPYLEWKHSVYPQKGLTCQKCHMPDAKGSVRISTRPRRYLPTRKPFAKHHFVGGNVFILSILRDNSYLLETPGSRYEINKTIQRTIKFLQNETANLHIGTVSFKNGILEFPVIVENKAGHKFPADLPIRRAWLHVIVKDKNGRVIFESGAVRKDGKIIGADSDEDIIKYEPHYEVITSEDQVQIYETIMKDYAGKITYTFLNAYEYEKDNRILPEGFNKITAPSDIAVKGKAFKDENFIGGSDTVFYKINTKGAKGPFTIFVELRFQTVTYPFFKDLLKDEDRSEYVRKFKKLYYTKPNIGIVIDKKEIKF